MSYRQLTEGQRYQISTLLSQEFSLRAIARNLNIAPSTVHRELQRNRCTSGVYRPDKAQQRTLVRRLKPKPKHISDNTRCAVEFMLELDWSPEQIAAICTRIGYPVSHEWIYNYVQADFNAGGELYTHLRHKLKRYKRRFALQHGRILDRRSIHDRPLIIDQRGRYGDWEIDSVIGKQGTGAMVTLEFRQMFKRFQKETHMFAEREISASYDRFSTLFTLSLGDKVLVSKRLMFTLKYEREIEIESKIYNVYVFEFILWRSKLTEKNEVIIDELIPSRKRKSIGALIYSLALNVARLLS